jgi:hypothetical protein
LAFGIFAAKQFKCVQLDQKSQIIGIATREEGFTASSLRLNEMKSIQLGIAGIEGMLQRFNRKRITSAKRSPLSRTAKIGLKDEIDRRLHLDLNYWGNLSCQKW